MPFIEHNDVIEAFPSNRPDDALSEGNLPGRPRGDEDLAHSQAVHPPDEHVAVDGIPIAEQVLGRRLVREPLDQLVGSSDGGGVVGDVDMDEFSTVVSKDQEPEEQAEGERRYNEEVDRDNVMDMRLEEGAPRAGRPRRGASHVLGDSELGDLIAEKVEFSLDPAPSPDRIVSGHVADQGAELKIERAGVPLSGAGTSSARRAGNLGDAKRERSRAEQ
jgi:hypothetical protein